MTRKTTATALMLGLLAFAIAGPAPAATKKKSTPPPDKTPPALTIAGQPRQVYYPGPTLPPPVSSLTGIGGAVTDNQSGVKTVNVWFRPCTYYGAPECTGIVQHTDPNFGWDSSGRTASTTRVTCTNSTKRSCTWTAAGPATPGGYFMWVSATDAAKNTKQVPFRYIWWLHPPTP